MKALVFTSQSFNSETRFRVIVQELKTSVLWKLWFENRFSLHISSLCLLVLFALEETGFASQLLPYWFPTRLYFIQMFKMQENLVKSLDSASLKKKKRQLPASPTTYSFYWEHVLCLWNKWYHRLYEIEEDKRLRSVVIEFCGDWVRRLPNHTKSYWRRRSTSLRNRTVPHGN